MSAHFPRTPRAAALAFALLVAVPACSRERTRVVEEPALPRSEGRDYRGMLERVRARQTPTQIQYELEIAIRRFQHDLSRLPTNLMELVARRYVPALKPPPSGYVYSYDPVHGNVALVPVTIDGQIRLPENLEAASTRIEMRSPPLPPPPL